MSAPSAPSLARKQILQVVLFDVSASMQSPLKLRANAADANKKSGDLEPKRVHTVFDTIYRLAEDGISQEKDRDVHAAVLCFSLSHVNTCDLLAFLEKRTEVIGVLEMVQAESRSELPYNQVVNLLSRYGFSPGDVQVPNVSTTRSGERLYRIVGHKPLVELLARAGARYCEKYVDEHVTPEDAGKYFMAFAVPERSGDLHTIVERLPEACKTYISASRVATNYIPFGIGSSIQKDAASDAMKLADKLLARNKERANQQEDPTLSLLRSIPTAAPKPIGDVLKLLKLLKSMQSKKRQHTTEEEVMDWESLLDDIEPYLYGWTPMCEALRSMQPLWQNQTYSSKVMTLISDGGATDGDPVPLAQALLNAGGTIFTCLLTDSDIEEPRRPYGAEEVNEAWPKEARDMFTMASIASYDSGPIQALRRRGWELPASGKCKLFIQANNPIILDEFTTASRNLSNSSDALAGLVGEVKLDTYIQSSNRGAEVTKQKGPICWAHACASVIHLSLHRIVGREEQNFEKIRDHMTNVFEKRGQNTGAVLTKICPLYKLHSKEVTEAGARVAIYARRPVVATFSLDESRWDNFSDFFKLNPKHTLTAGDMTATARGKMDGHAVVLIRCDDTSLTFMNSWGTKFANNGFFTVDKASTLEIENGPAMRFFDVYWTLADLSAGEIAAWDSYQAEKVGGVIDALLQSFHHLPVSCPRCKNTAEACKYGGSWNEARCEACNGTFTPIVQALVRTLYESNYDSI